MRIEQLTINNWCAVRTLQTSLVGCALRTLQLTIGAQCAPYKFLLFEIVVGCALRTLQTFIFSNNNKNHFADVLKSNAYLNNLFYHKLVNFLEKGDYFLLIRLNRC